MAKATGQVEVIYKKGKAWNFKLKDGDWFGHGFNQPKFDKGDYVEVEYEMNGRFKNATSVKKIQQPQQSHTKQQLSAKDQYWENRELGMSFGGARNAAIELVKLAVEQGILPLPAQKNKKMEALFGYVSEYTLRMFKQSIAVLDEVNNDKEAFLSDGVFSDEENNNNTEEYDDGE